MMGDPSFVTLQLRLLDRFGDNGMISVIIGKVAGDTLELDTWLMSCRVLGRQVEDATLNLIVDLARAKGIERLAGFYLPSAKNSMVREHYARLGFVCTNLSEDGSSVWSLDLKSYEPRNTCIQTVEGALDPRSDLRAAH